MSNMVMTNPRTRRDSEWQVKRLHHSLRRGVMSDFPRAAIPLDGIYASENIIIYSDRAESRSGTRLLSSSHATLPTVTGGSSISASKSGYLITISSGYTPSDANIGDYFVWSDDGENELITGVSGQVLTVTSSNTHTATTTGRIRQEINAHIWDKVNKKHIILIGSKVYYSSWNATSWTEVVCISNTLPENSKSTFNQLGSEMYLWNDNGLFVLDLSVQYPTLYKINNTIGQCGITGVDKTDELVYGRRYTFSLAKMSGNTLLDIYNGNEVLKETATCSDNGSGGSYSEIFTSLPVGDETDTYSQLKELTTQEFRGHSPSTYSVLSNAQFKITLNSVTNNIIVNFTGCITWKDISEKLTERARDYFPYIDIYYEDGYFIIENKISGSVLGYCTDGDAGTDISGNSYLGLTSSISQITTQYLSKGSSIGYLSLPSTTVGSYYYYSREYTHYRIYATKDVGANGVNQFNGIGNNPELYIHVADIPIIKSFACTYDGATVTAVKGMFSKYDVGSNLLSAGGAYNSTISGYISPTKVSIASPLTISGVIEASIGTRHSFTINQSGYTVTLVTGGEYFSDQFVGGTMFLSDGTTMVITKYNSITSVDVDTSATRTGDGCGVIIRESTSIPCNRKYYDTISDDVLSYRIAKYGCKNRFLEPIPDCSEGVIVDGFMVSAIVGESSIYETQLSSISFAGYYDPEFQIDTIHDSIQALKKYPGLLVAICSQSTISWSTEVVGTDSRPSIGQSTSYLAQRNPVDEKTGTLFPGSIANIDEGMDILFTNSSEVRLFDGRAYGPNLAEGKIMKLLRKLQHIGSSSYDPISGYILWGTDGVMTTVGTKTIVPFPGVCWRFSIKEEQGVIGGVQFTGDDWLKPPNSLVGQEITDGSDRSLQVIFDNVTGKMYWVSTYDGPTGSNLEKTFLDKDDAVTPGTEIPWSITYGADTGALMKYDIRHDVSNLSMDPYDPSNANQTGYDSHGYRSGLQIDVYAYCKSNEWADPYSSALDITIDGDISFDETPEDKAIQIKIVGNRSECVISEIVNYYTNIEQAAVPSKREMTEGDYQSLLAAPTLWLSRNQNLYKNLVTGQSIPGTVVPVTGVDGKSNSAFQLTAALSTISVSITSGTILVWIYGTVVLAIGGTTITLTQIGSVGTWYLYYASGVTKTGVLTLTPPVICRICDLRVYNSDVNSAVRTYLYNDMVRNNGSNTLRLW